MVSQHPAKQYYASFAFLPACVTFKLILKYNSHFSKNNQLLMIQSVNIAFWVQRWADLHPQKNAIVFENRQVSYSKLNRLTNRTACWLQSLGIEKGDRVAVMLSNCPEFIELYLACSRLGAIFVPVNFRLAGQELVYILNNADPRLFVFGPEYAELMQNITPDLKRPIMHMASLQTYPLMPNVLNYREDTEKFAGQDPNFIEHDRPSDPEEPQVIMYTSGTTGQPKGAVLSHRKTFFNCLNADIFFKLHFDDIMLIFLPLFHSGGLFIQASPSLYKGATMVIQSKFDPEHVYNDIEQLQVTKLLGVPTVFNSLLRVEPAQYRNISSLRVCAIGGEKTTPELLAHCKEKGFPLRQIMGQTETSILLWASEEDSIRKPGTVGRPVFHAKVNVFDREGRPVAPNRVGEIVARGSIMMNAYWRDPVRTRDTIKDGWLYTGDLAYQDEDGYFFLVDRAKDMYISGGENVYPSEVEKAIRLHPAVADVAVVGEPDVKWGEVGKAYVILQEGKQVQAEEIMSFCQERLARFKCPKSVNFSDQFPRTSLGKVRKHKL